MTVKEKIEQLRLQLHQHNYNYYVLNAPEISDKEFDDLMRELQHIIIVIMLMELETELLYFFFYSHIFLGLF